MAFFKDSMPENILPVLRKAAAIIMEIYADEKRFMTSFKEDESPLTEADKQANDIILRGLHELYPGIPVISEETANASYDERKNYDTYFLVDPLDGTKEFVKRNGEFTVNIGFMHGSDAIGGFVIEPVTGIAYYAERGKGAHQTDAEGRKMELRSKPFHLYDEGIHVVASRSHRDARTEQIISRLNKPVIVSSGSSLKFAMIAEGKAHFYPRLAPTMEWDTAAAQCILEEAGGSVLQIENLEPLIYNKEDLLNPHFVAFGALLDPEHLKDLFSY